MDGTAFRFSIFGFIIYYCFVYSVAELGRSSNTSHHNVSAHEAKARTDCVESNQSKDCSVAVKSQHRVQSGTAVTTAVAGATAGNHKLRQAQHQHHHHKSTPALRRKATAIKKQPAKSTPAVTPKPQQQVINRARGTLHGLSTIKRHGNVRVT